MVTALVRSIRDRFNHRSRGVNPDRDIRRILRATTIRTIFDVGAHVGGSAKRFRRAYPDAEIYAFEPDPANFIRLRLSGIERCRCCHVGLGDSIDDYRFDDRLPPDKRRIADDQNDESLPYVPFSSVDKVVDHIGIDHIDILKIDTPHSVSVLRGAKEMLECGKLSIVEIECAADVNNCCCTILEQFGFRLFETYKRKDRQPNIIYISPEVLRENERRS